MDKRTKISLGFQSKDNLISAVASIPFGNKVGADLRVESITNNKCTFSFSRLPGIMRFNLIQTIGNANDGINAISAKLYADLIKKISGAKSIEKSDFMLYLFGGKSIIDIIRQLKTIYQLAFEYKEYNLYYGRAMLYAFGVDPDDITANIEDYRGWLNTVIRRFNSLNFPNLPIMKSGWDYGRTILVDNPDLQHSQAYIFTVATAYIWDPLFDPNGTCLMVTDVLNPGLGSGMTFAGLQSRMKTILDSYLFDDDVIDISAWVRNMYEDNTIILEEVTRECDDVQVVYDPEALSIVENADVMPSNLSVLRNQNYQIPFRMIQNNNYIKQTISAVTNYTDSNNYDICCYLQPHIYNFHKSKPSYDEIARATSLKIGSYGDIAVNGPCTYVANITSDYSITDVVIYKNPNNNNDYIFLYGNEYAIVDNASSFNDSAVTTASLLETFDWHPIFYAGQFVHDNTNNYVKVAGLYWTVNRPLFDFDNYTVLSNTIINNILDAMWYVMFGTKKV